MVNLFHDRPLPVGPNGLARPAVPPFRTMPKLPAYDPRIGHGPPDAAREERSRRAVDT